MTRPALFLDRDGVINVDHGYVHRWEDFEYVPGIVELIRHFNGLDWPVVVVTNQSGIARGYYSEEQMHALHAALQADLAQQGARLDAVYFCPYLKGAPVAAYDRNSPDRKPKPGMLLRAAREMGLDLAASILIGDGERDIIAAQVAGARGFLFKGVNVWDFARARVLPELT
ncbi:D-glycero-alpha-D-manno-heptose-1,7-bisphosphate 7-phosphatase [Acidimangrovimonas pyrenivorans]|uniref:D,D-heptose 1,7-bisphosphate phosphatase n=1 Tax=Acidimangrovimonas pyrenivorans TaxID=2030798 RepID=A0ABV7ANG8_9RHOB